MTKSSYLLKSSIIASLFLLFCKVFLFSKEPLRQDLNTNTVNNALIAIPRIRVERSALNAERLHQIRERYPQLLGEITVNAPGITISELGLLNRYFPYFELFVMRGGQRVAVETAELDFNLYNSAF